MAKKLPYFKMYPADADTDENFRLMTMEQRGMYWTLLNHAWRNEGIPADTEDIRAICGMPLEDFSRAWTRVSKCFISNGVRLHNPRQEEERSVARSKSEKATYAVRTRYERTTSTPTEVVPRALARADSDSVSVSVASSEGGAGGNPPIFEFSDWFERQYSRHPRKKNRILAEQAAVSAFSAGEFTFEDFERRHVAWCASEEWRWKNGARAPDLAAWIGDKGFRYEPPSEVESNGTYAERIAAL